MNENIQNGLNVLGTAVGDLVSNVATNMGLQLGQQALTLGIKSVGTNALKGAATNALKSSLGSSWNVAGMAADVVGSFLPLKTEYSGDRGSITRGLDTAYDAVQMGVNAIPGVGLAISGAMALGKFATKGINALGGGTDGMSSTDAILGSNFLALTPMGLINGFGGKKTNTIAKDYDTFARMGSSYGGTDAAMTNATHYSGKKYGAFSSSARKKANELIRNAATQLARLGDISSNQQMTDSLLANQSSMAGQATAFELSGGFDATATRAARQGMKFPKSVNRAIRLAKGASIKLKPVFKFDFSCLDNIDVPEFKDGGAINVIPEGALHAHKHHMENDEDITKKGIPVVVEEGGKLNQQAEIEREEIILHLDLTKKLEELSKKYYSENTSNKEKEECAIEAGKLLAEEILENTDDRTGLMNTIE